MGQLERYGLYVLCLVIFLILGVAIWGGDPQTAGTGGGDLTSELGRMSTPIGDPRAPQPVAGDNQYLSEFLDLNNGPPRTQGSPPTAARTEVKDDSPPPAPTPTPPTAAPPVTTEATYVVKKGDILSEISRRELGTQTRWKEIEALNPGIKEKNLLVGMELVMPPRRATSSKREWFFYVVKKDDNYSTISHHLYGTQKHAGRIRDLNPNVDPMKLKPGSQIRVPFLNN